MSDEASVECYGHFIDGEWVPASSGETIELRNPATGGVLAQIASGGCEDVSQAVEAAHRAFGAWSQSRPGERQELLLEMARRIRVRAQDYALFEALNNGKPISEAQFFDIPMAAETFEFFAGAAFFHHGETFDTQDAVCMIRREPLGVCAQIIPWNVPMVMMAMKIAPALVAGNTVVLKPSEICCLSVLEFFRDIQNILPAGLINVVTGYGAQVGDPLVTHPMVSKVAFTGSRPTAQAIMRNASVNIIPQTLELGGKSANIVCQDADIEAAVEAVVMSTVFNKGEVCLAGSRVFLHRSIEDAFLERLAAVMKTIRIGDPTDPATQLGAQASASQFRKVSDYLELGLSEGAQTLVGGGPAQVAGLPNGFFVQPTVFTGVRNDMRIAQEEIFGPVTCVIPWDDEDDVVRLANASPYGLGGGLWTRDLARAHRMSRQIDTGVVWVNRYYNFAQGLPVGGYKQSGFGREGWLETLNHYSQVKSVVFNLSEGPLGIFGGA